MISVSLLRLRRKIRPPISRSHKAVMTCCVLPDVARAASFDSLRVADLGEVPINTYNLHKFELAATILYDMLWVLPGVKYP